MASRDTLPPFPLPDLDEPLDNDDGLPTNLLVFSAYDVRDSQLASEDESTTSSPLSPDELLDLASLPKDAWKHLTNLDEEWEEGEDELENALESASKDEIVNDIDEGDLFAPLRPVYPSAPAGPTPPPQPRPRPVATASSVAVVPAIPPARPPSIRTSSLPALPSLPHAPPLSSPVVVHRKVAPFPSNSSLLFPSRSTTPDDQPKLPFAPLQSHSAPITPAGSPVKSKTGSERKEVAALARLRGNRWEEEKQRGGTRSVTASLKRGSELVAGFAVGWSGKKLRTIR
ncbi:hypothetical protein JCM8547_003405 [Rhodosporidiobolus lusitaniae]